MLAHHHREHPSHITINSKPQVSTINSSDSPGYLPPVNQMKSPKQQGFLYRYNNTNTPRTQVPTFSQSTSTTPAFSSNASYVNSANYGNGSVSNLCTNTMNSSNYGNCATTSYTNCFADLQNELQRQKCSPMNFQDICNSCCYPQKPICSDDPNCFMFKECRKNVLGQTCKYLQNRGPILPSWLAHCGRVCSTQYCL